METLFSPALSSNGMRILLFFIILLSPLSLFASQQAHRIELSGESMRNQIKKTIISLGVTDKKNNFVKSP